MKFLLDENQSPRIAELLNEAGHDAVHVREIDLRTSPDEDVLAAARGAGRVIISADTDFGELLAASNAAGPSIVLLRRQGQRRAGEIAALILANLDVVGEELQVGCRRRPRRGANPDSTTPAPARLTSRSAPPGAPRCMHDVCVHRVFRRVRSCCPVHGATRETW